MFNLKMSSMEGIIILSLIIICVFGGIILGYIECKKTLKWHHSIGIAGNKTDIICDYIIHCMIGGLFGFGAWVGAMVMVILIFKLK